MLKPIHALKRFSFLLLLDCCISVFSESVGDNLGDDASFLQVLQSVRSKATLSRAEDSETGRSQAKDPVLDIRPGSLHGVVDEIEFGINLKKFYGVDFVAGTFSLDGIITTQWSDSRNKQLVEDGLELKTFAIERAKAEMWLPDTVVTNKAHGGYDIISSSVRVYPNGTTIKIERALMTLKNKFDVASFPFDEQVLAVRIASAVYMADELKFVPSPKSVFWGGEHLNPELFATGAWILKNETRESIIEDDGMLVKSRGLLSMELQRRVIAYMSTVFVPSAVLLMMTWASLWFPLVPAFMMPRVALCSIALLSMVALAQRSDSMSPPSGRLTWLDRYLEMCIVLQFMLLMVIGMLTVIQQRLGNDKLAVKLDVEMIIAFPIFVMIVLGSSFLKAPSIGHVVVSVLTLGILSYFICRYKIEVHEMKQEEARNASQ